MFGNIVNLNAGLGAKTLLLAQSLGLVTTLATTGVVRAGAAVTGEDIALRAGLLGHGSDLLGVA